MLKVTAVRSPLPVMSSILPCPPCLPQVMQTQIQGGPGRVEGEGEGGRGHFIHLAPPYCTTTWCFALKGLRTTSSEYNFRMRYLTKTLLGIAPGPACAVRCRSAHSEVYALGNATRVQLQNACVNPTPSTYLPQRMI